MPIFTQPIDDLLLWEHGHKGEKNYPHPAKTSTLDKVAATVLADPVGEGVQLEMAGGRLLDDIEHVFGAYRDTEARAFGQSLLAQDTPWFGVTVKRGEPDFEHPYSEERSVKFDLTGIRPTSLGEVSLVRRSPTGPVHGEIGLVWIEAGQRGKNVAKPILRSFVEAFEQQGATRIELTAVDLGSYAWLRYGFVPKRTGAFIRAVRQRLSRGNGGYFKSLPPEARKYIKDALADLDAGDAKAAWRLSDFRIGTRNVGLEILRGVEWRGELDLQDSEQRTRLDTYIRGT